MTNQPYKVCPQCHTPAPLDAAFCAQCRHVYRTKFTPPDQTQAFNVPPPVAPPPSFYPPPGYYPPAGYIQVPRGTHSPVVAVLLSIFCVICLGQFYNRQYAKGLLLLVVSIVCAFCTFGLSALLLYPFCVIDAGVVAGRLNRGEMVRDWQFF